MKLNVNIESEVCPSCHKEKSCHDMERLIVCMNNFIKNELGTQEEQSFNHSSRVRN